MNKKLNSLKELEEKAWFRFVKVVYLGALIVVSLFLLLLTWTLGSSIKMQFFIWGAVIIAVLAWLIRGAFFYIVLGKFNPYKKKRGIDKVDKLIKNETNNDKTISESMKFIENYKFIDTSKLSVAIIVLGVINMIILLVYISASLIILFNLSEYPAFSGLFQLIWNETFDSLTTILPFASFIVYLFWISKTYANLYAFNKKTINTPGWAVGHYLIPIINLYEPYKNMKEIWLNFLNEDSDKNKKYLFYLKIWWGIWITTLIVGVFYKYANVDLLINQGEIEIAFIFDFLVNIVSVINILLLLFVVKFVTTLQINQHKNASKLSIKWLRKRYLITLIVAIVLILLSTASLIYYNNVPKCDLEHGWQSSSGRCYCDTFYRLDTATNLCVPDESKVKEKESEKKSLDEIFNEIKTIECPQNASLLNGICQCDYGYIYSDYTSSCISENEICETMYGGNTYGTGGQCFCNYGFEWNDDQTACIQNAFIQISSHNSYSSHGSEPIYVEGKTSANCSQIIVNASNDSGKINDEWTLTEYKEGDTKFRYKIARDLDNLASGSNNYMFTVYCDNDQIKQQEITIFFTQRDSFKQI